MLQFKKQPSSWSKTGTQHIEFFLNYTFRDVIIQAHGKIRVYGKTGEAVEYFLWECMNCGIRLSDTMARVT